MCSIVESGIDLAERKPAIKGGPCKKCRIEKSVVNLRVNDAYCKDCFLTGAHHKFRATLGKHKVMKPRDKVLVACSGSAGSMALLHLIHTGRSSAHKRLLFDPSVLVIDDGGAFGMAGPERKGFVEKVLEVTRQFEFPTYVVALESVFEEVADIREVTEAFEYDPPTSQTMKDTFSNVKESSAKEALLGHLRKKMMISATETLQCQKLFTAESETTLAVSLLAGIATGRGSHLPNDTGFLDRTTDTVKAIRAMREFSKKEIILYAQFFKLEYIVGPAFGVKSDSFFSINKLTEDFVVGLQEDFPATIPTVFRTGDKMKVDNKDVESRTCLLCQGSLDISLDACNSLQATTFSQLVSSKGAQGFSLEELAKIQNLSLSEDPVGSKDVCADQKSECSGEGLCSEGGGGCHSNANQEVSKEEVVRHVCYSCRIIVQKMSVLPKFLVEAILKEKRRNGMRKEIEGFLLEDK